MPLNREQKEMLNSEVYIEISNRFGSFKIKWPDYNKLQFYQELEETFSDANIIKGICSNEMFLPLYNIILHPENKLNVEYKLKGASREDFAEAKAYMLNQLRKHARDTIREISVSDKLNESKKILGVGLRDEYPVEIPMTEEEKRLISKLRNIKLNSKYEGSRNLAEQAILILAGLKIIAFHQSTHRAEIDPTLTREEKITVLTRMLSLAKDGNYQNSLSEVIPVLAEAINYLKSIIVSEKEPDANTAPLPTKKK